MSLCSASLFAVGVLAEIGGAFLIWRVVRNAAPMWEAGGLCCWLAMGPLALRGDPHFRRVLGPTAASSWRVLCSGALCSAAFTPARVTWLVHVRA